MQTLLSDMDGLVRQRAAAALTIMARKSLFILMHYKYPLFQHIEHSLGRQAFLELGIITSLSKLVGLYSLTQIHELTESLCEVC